MSDKIKVQSLTVKLHYHYY